ncbi:MAG: 2-oxo acid dehydrogenase subunit E2 [Clostridia bacterium]|nr:2-oxo acid dehydrogenase subunit E2 [Clostridia bacterium]
MFEVKFADIGEGIHEGVLYKLEKKVGDLIEEGDTLFLVETDKVTAEIPSPISGKIHQVHFSEGDTIMVGQTIVSIETNEKVEPVKHEIVKEKESTSVVGDLEISSEVIPSSEEIIRPEEQSFKKVLATPVARKLAKDLKVDINSIEGSGPAGRVMKTDILSYSKSLEPIIESTNNATKEVLIHAETHVEKMSMMRKTIAEKMVQSKFTIPHTAMMDEVLVDQLVAFKNDIKDIAEENQVHITYLAFVIKAVAVALKKHPIINSSLNWEDKTIIYHDTINMGIAVDTKDGLTVPVIKHVEQMGVLEIAKAIEVVAQKAREKKLSIEDLQNGTFTITNYGALGSSFGVPIINYPEVAILGIGKISKKPVVKEDCLDIGYLLPLSMSFDHRIVDGGDAGRFMNTLKTLLEEPKLLLLS